MDTPDTQTARSLLAKIQDGYTQKAPKAIAILETGFDDATAILGLLERYRKRLRTTNGVERLNEEIRRRERVIRIFPTRESVIRLLGALLSGKHIIATPLREDKHPHLETYKVPRPKLNRFNQLPEQTPAGVVH